MQGVLTFFIVFVLFPGVILGFILLSRYLKYRETLTMIQHGITPPPPPPRMMMPPPPMQRPPVVVNQGSGGGGRAILIWGLVLTGIGIALTLALWPIGFIANSASGNTVNFPLGLGPWMLAGFVPLFVGLALILGYVITRPERGNGSTPQVPFPMREGRDGGAYGHMPFVPGPIVPTAEGGAIGAYPAQMPPGIPAGNGSPTAQPAVAEEASESAPPSSPTP